MLIVVPILVLWYAGQAVLSRFAGTCTMGDTDRFLGGMMLGAPGAASAVVLLLVAPPRVRWRTGVMIAIAPLSLVVLYLWIPLAISAGVRGHHLCGPEFDAYLDAASGWERLIPLAHVAAALALLVSGVRNCRRVESAAQPGVEPDGRLRGRGLTP